MNQRKVVYILLPLVALIWGLIIYRVNHVLQDKPQTANDAKPDSAYTSEVTFEKYSVHPPQRDPFLSRISRDNEYKPARGDTAVKITTTVPRTKAPVYDPAWPEVKYSGLIYNTETKKMVGIFEINKRRFNLQEKQTQEGVKVEKVFKDSVFVSWNKEKKTIYK